MADWPDVLARTYDVVRGPVVHLDEAMLDRPSPCTEWSVRALVEHTIGAIDMFADAAAGSSPAATVVAGAVVATLVERFDAAARRNLAAWRSLEDPTAPLTLPFGQFPAEVVAGINQLDSLVHAWDIGASLGLRVALPDDLADTAMRMAQVRVPLGRGHVFGPEVITAATGSGERLLAFTGRDLAAWPGAVWVAGSLVTANSNAIDPTTASAVEIWERQGSSPPRHVHAEHDEIWYVLEGRFTFAVGEREFQATAGDVVVGPHGVPHTFRAETPRSRLIDIHTPGGFERFFVQAGIPATALVPPPPGEPRNPAALRATIEAFGATVVGPPLSTRLRDQPGRPA